MKFSVFPSKPIALFLGAWLLFMFFSCDARRKQPIPKYRPLLCPSFGNASGVSSGSGFFHDYSVPSTGPKVQKVMVTENQDGIEDLSGKLTATEVNDFEHWTFWGDIREYIKERAEERWGMKPVDRYTVQVVNEKNIGLNNQKVELITSKSKVLWTARTDAFGRAELWRNFMGGLDSSVDLYVRVSSADQILRKPARKLKDGINHFVIENSCNQGDKLQIAFMVDATTSMSDEVDFLRSDLKNLITHVKDSSGLNTEVGSVFYKCPGNSEWMNSFDFTSTVDELVTFIDSQKVDGGGDEAVEVALSEILELSWDSTAIARVVFLMLDEAPGYRAGQLDTLHQAITTCASRGIRLVPIVSSGTTSFQDKMLEYLMRSMALATNGTSAFLTDDSGIGDSHTDPTAEVVKVETLKDLMFRVIREMSEVKNCDERDMVVEQDSVVLASLEHWIKADSNFVFPEPVLPADTNSVPESNPKVDTIINQVDKIAVWSLQVYPNPASQYINLKIMDMDKDAELYISDMRGKLLIHLSGDLTQNEYQFDVSSFSAGMYHVRVDVGTSSKSVPFFVR